MNTHQYSDPKKRASQPERPLSIRYSVLKFIKEVVSFIINNNKGGEVLNPDFSYGFHSEFFKIDNFHRFDIFFRQNCSRTAN